MIFFLLCEAALHGSYVLNLPFVRTLLRPIQFRGGNARYYYAEDGCNGTYCLPLLLLSTHCLSKRRITCCTFVAKLSTLLQALRLSIILLHISRGPHLRRPNAVNLYRVSAVRAYWRVAVTESVQIASKATITDHLHDVLNRSVHECIRAIAEISASGCACVCLSDYIHELKQ